MAQRDQQARWHWGNAGKGLALGNIAGMQTSPIFTGFLLIGSTAAYHRRTLLIEWHKINPLILSSRNSCKR